MRMSSVRSWSSLGGGDGGSKESTKILPADVIKTGYLKKLKTMRKKFFVLRGDSSDASARLEYYDSEKKWKAHQNPKRSITLKTCFNINRRSDIRQKHVIALYTKNDCFCVVLETEEELDDWLKALLSLQHGEEMPDGELPKPTFEHVWQVNVQKKELGNSRNILGPYHLCLTDRTLSLVKRGTDKPESIEFSLQSIRRCGHLDSFFYMEVGQASVTGAGNLWMQTEDPNIAQNMHDAILSACTNCSKKDLAPKSRNRSSSANEASKPITVMQRWPTHAGLTGGVRERCDSLPSRARTTSEGAHQHLPHPPRSHLAPSHSRPHSMYNRGISYSPPVASSPVSPASGACSTDSAGSSLSMDGDGMGEGSWGMGEGESGRYGHSLTPDEPVIMEENCDDYAPWPAEDEKPNNYVPMDGSLCLPIQPTTASGNTGYRKYSPNPGSSGFKSSSPSQGSGIDMYSPCGSSPLETPSTYMPMSPGDSRTPVYGRAGGSANHSRGSSLAEEGYVPMAPGDGYVDVASGDHSNNHQFRSGDMSPGGSSCSITSGTPSTDIRFSEYTLEKVSTYFTPSEDEIAPNERPARAYSVGSRPVNLNTRPETANHVECRVRAFSVGSRSIPRGRTIPHPHLTPPTRHILSSSHSSVEPSEDLMELDFTRNKTSRNRKTVSLKKLTSSSSERLIPPSGSTVSSAASSYSTAEGSYMDPSPRGSPKPSDNESDTTHVGPSPPKTTRMSSFMGRSPPKTTYAYMDMKPGHISSSPPVSSSYPSPPLYRVPEGESGYVEMQAGVTGELLPGTSPPVKSLSTSPKGIAVQPPVVDGYMEMKPGGDAKQVTPKSTQPRVETFPVTETVRPQNLPKTTSVPPPIKQALLTTQALSKSKTGQEDYLDMTQKRKISVVEDNNNSRIIAGQHDTPNRTTDGYVEMSWSGNKPFRKSSLESFKVNNTEEYLNMGGGSLSGNNKRERRGSRNDRNRYSSQPITIQSTNVSTDSASTSPVYTFAGRKHSTGTPPKIPSFLPLGNYGSSSPSSSPFSSLRRSRQRKTSRRESKELNSSGLTTPTGSTTTIFPFSLNSPGSPLKPFGAQSSKEEQESSKCPVDATSGTVKISSCPVKETDTPVMRRNVTNKPDERDYVNYSPRASRELPSDQDYTVMNPINTTPEPVRKVTVSSTTAPVVSESVKTKPVDRLVNDITNLSLVTQSSVVVPVPSGSRTSDSTSSENTRLSEVNGSDVSSRSGEQTVVSRTPSVSSVGEKELHYASLDLARSNSECDDGGGGSAAGASGGGGLSHAPSLKSQSSLTESSSASTPSPNLASDASFIYAEIDFTKSASSRKLRH